MLTVLPHTHTTNYLRTAMVISTTNSTLTILCTHTCLHTTDKPLSSYRPPSPPVPHTPHHARPHTHTPPHCYTHQHFVCIICFLHYPYVSVNNLREFRSFHPRISTGPQGHHVPGTLEDSFVFLKRSWQEEQRRG